MKPIQERAAGAARGFTLIELLVAVTLLALVVIPALGRIGESTAMAERRIADRIMAHRLLEAMTRQATQPESETASRDTVLGDGRRFRLMYESKSGTRSVILFYSVLAQRGSEWDTLATLRRRHWNGSHLDSR